MSAVRPISSSFPALGRNVVSGRRHTFTGYVPSSKVGNEHRLIAYESLLERDFIQLLEDDDDVISYADRSEAVIWTDSAGVKHRYLPDFDVCRRDGMRVCVEVKPFERVLRRNLLPHYEQIERFALGSGRFHRFEIWTDREIRASIPLYNAELRNVGRLNREGLSASLSVVSALRSLGGCATLAEVRERSGLGGGAFWAIVQSLASDSLHLEDRRRPVDDSSVVHLEQRS